MTTQIAKLLCCMDTLWHIMLIYWKPFTGQCQVKLLYEAGGASIIQVLDGVVVEPS